MCVCVFQIVCDPQPSERSNLGPIWVVAPKKKTAMGWTVRGSNPGKGEIFRTRPDRPWDPPSLLYNGCRVYPGGKAAGAWR